MSGSDLPARLARRVVLSVPPLRALAEAAYRRGFARSSGPVRLFQGIYADFAAAAAAAPRDKPLGYDNEATAYLLEPERHAVDPTDYPVLFWLSRLLPANRAIFDLGGNVGISYYKYRSYLTLPPGAAWLVHDVPAVVAAGRAIAAAEHAPGLRFTTDYAEVGAADILLATGCVQFLSDPVDFLRGAARLPAHILVNKTPLYRMPSAVTLHGTGTAYCPYWLFNRDDFIALFTGFGYQVADAWLNPGLSCSVPLHPKYTVHAYSGFLFSLSANTG